MSRLVTFVIAAAVVGAIGFVLDLVAAHHSHHCRVCGRKGTHLDAGCDEPEALLCPDCGGDVDDLDLRLMLRVAGLVALTLVAVGAATGDAVAPLVTAPISLIVLWRLLTVGPADDDPEPGEDDGPAPEGTAGSEGVGRDG